MEIDQDVMISLLNHDFTRFEVEDEMNKVLVYLLVQTVHQKSRVIQKDIIDEFKSNKYKMGIILKYMEGARLINIDKRMEHSYTLTQYGQVYLLKFMKTEKGKKIIEEAGYIYE